MKKNIKEETETKIFSSILIFLFLSIAGFLFYSNYNINKRRQQLLGKINDLKQEIEILQTRNADLKQGVVDNEDLAYWEQRIREVGYQKPGETMVVMKKDDGQINADAVADKNTTWKNFLGQIKNVFE